MKKLFALVLALIMLLSLAACGGEKTPESGTDNNSSSKPTPDASNSISIDWEALDSALSVLDTLKPEGWDEDPYGMYIYDVWDQEFLPDVMPAPIDGIKIDSTRFKDYNHDVMNKDYSVGPIEYDDYKDYRKYSVSFNATIEQLDAFIAAVKEKGFVGTETTTHEEDSWWEYYYYNESGWFMHIFFNTVSSDGYDGFASVSLTDSIFDKPASVAGIPLPQKGAPAYDYTKYSFYFDENYDEVSFDITKDTFPDSYYAIFFEYYGVDAKYCKEYTSQLVNAGWTIEQEDDKVESENNYYALLKKDGEYSQVYFAPYNGFMQVGFCTMPEGLQY